MIIALDFDEVLADTLPAWLDAYYEQSGRRLYTDEIYDWNLANYIPTADVPLFYSSRTPELYDGWVTPVTGAADALRKLVFHGYQLVVVTAECHTNRAMREAKQTFLARHFAGVPFNAMLFSGTESKWDLLKAAGVEILLDDGLHNQPTHIFRRPWNDRWQDLLPWAKPVYNWRDFVDAMMEHPYVPTV